MSGIRSNRLAKQPLPGHDLSPGAGEKGCNDRVIADKIGTSPDFSCYFHGQQIALLCLHQSLHGTTLSLAIFGGVAALLAFKGPEQHSKMLRIAGMLFREHDGHFLQALHEFQKPRCALAGIAQAGTGDGFKQPSGRVAFVAEKPGVRHRQPQKGRLGVCDDLSDRQQHPFIMSHLLDHHSDHFNGQRLAQAFRVGPEMRPHLRQRWRWCRPNPFSACRGMAFFFKFSQNVQR